jgi:hypothetical protein
MSHTHKPGTSYTTDAGTIVSVNQTFTANTEFSYDNALATGAVNIPFLVNFADDDLISCIISSDQALTLNVNSTGAPTPAIAVAAGAPIVWNNTSTFANPFTTTPVTAIYINNASGTTANVKLYFLVDSD